MDNLDLKQFDDIKSKTKQTVSSEEINFDSKSLKNDMIMTAVTTFTKSKAGKKVIAVAISAIVFSVIGIISSIKFIVHLF